MAVRGANYNYRHMAQQLWLRRRYERYVRNGIQLTFWLPLSETSGSIAKNAAYTAAPGANVVVNGSFATDTVWVKGTGWTIGSGVATHAPGTGSDLSQASILTAGDTYRTTLTVSGRTAGTLDVKHGSTSRLTISANGIYSVDGIADGTGLVLTASATFDGSVDDVTTQLVGQMDAANTAATVGQTGKLGTAHAYDFDGATSLLTVANSASIQGLTELTLWALVYADSAGEVSNGTLFQKSGEWDIRYNSAALALTAQVAYSTTTAATVTTTTLSTGAWHTVSMKINDSTKTIRIFIDGVEASYATQTPGVGTRLSNTNALIIGNISTAARTWDGRIDEAFLKNAEISDAQDLQLARLVGVAA